jgi:hypothetical protein
MLHHRRVTDLPDPGWRGALPAAIPFFGRIVATRRQPQIVSVRALWVAFATTIVWIGVVVILLVSSNDPTGSIAVAIGAVLVAAVIGVVGNVWARLRRRRADPALNDPSAYRTSFYICLAFSEVPAMVGFVLALFTSREAPYLVGGALTLIGFAAIAPTRRFMAAQGPVLRQAFYTAPGG